MKKVKFALPVLAVVFAVVGAFATSNSNPILAKPVASNQSTCDQIGTCDEANENACKNGTTPLYIRVSSPSLSCTVAATGNFTAQ